MTVYAITDTKKGRTGIAPTYLSNYPLGDIKEIEKVQKRATKLIINFKTSYTDRLQRLNLPTLKYRTLCGDMIEVFKITHEIYDPVLSLKLVYSLNYNTRGNNY